MQVAQTLYDRLPTPIQTASSYPIHWTPSNVVNKVLDGFPATAWSRDDYKWLSCFSKNGGFEIGIYSRLMKGLCEQFPDVSERRNHIITNMIWSYCPDYATWMHVKRNFLGRVWDDISGYENLAGNVKLIDFNKDVVCELKNGAMMAKTADGYVKFDCIVGNPPYQMSDGAGGKGSSAGALYPAFVLKAMLLNPDYLSMVIPAKWMSGAGKGTTEFLAKMMASEKLSSITYEEDSKEWFPSIDLKGGVCFFMQDSTHKDHVVYVNNIAMDLKDEELILVDPIAVSIRTKVFAKSADFFSKRMLLRKPYGLLSNHSDWADDASGAYICYSERMTKHYVSKDLIKTNLDSIPKWKVIVAKASGSGSDGTGTISIIKPNEIVTESYLVLSAVDSEREANNVVSFLSTKLAQYLVSLLKTTHNVSSKVFRYLPYPNFNRAYSDTETYHMFGLSPEEIAHVDSFVKDFNMYRESKAKKAS